MRLTWRDGVATLIAAGVVAVVLAVSHGWDWPLLGSERAGIAALMVLGIAGCAFGNTRKMDSAAELVDGPFMLAGTALGTLALVLIVAGWISGSETLFVLLGIDLLLAWIVATTHHAVEGHRAPTHRLAEAHST